MLKILKLKIFPKGQRDYTVSTGLAWHTMDPRSIPDFPYGLRSSPGEIAECRFKSTGAQDQLVPLRRTFNPAKSRPETKLLFFRKKFF